MKSTASTNTIFTIPITMLLDGWRRVGDALQEIPKMARLD